MLRNKEVKGNRMDVSNKVTKDLLQTSCNYNKGQDLLGDTTVDTNTSFLLPEHYWIESEEATRFPNRCEEKISEAVIKRRYSSLF